MFGDDAVAGLRQPRNALFCYVALTAGSVVALPGIGTHKSVDPGLRPD
jgi:hypothetical protein